MNISSIITLVLETMLFIVPAVAFAIFIIWLLRRQMINGKTWRGWGILVSILIIFSVASFFLAKYNVDTETGTFPYQERISSIGVAMPLEVNIKGNGIQQASVDVSYNSTSGRVYGFGNLQIEYQDGIRYIPLEFDKMGNLTGSAEALQYKKELYRALRNNESKLVLTGDSVSYKKINQIKANHLPMKKEVLLPDYFFYYFFRLHIITVFLVGYYLLSIIRKRRKDKMNTDFIKILDL